MLVATSDHMELAKKLNERLEIGIASIDTKRFSDGDFYARMLTKDLGNETFIVHSLYPHQDSKIVELCYLADVCSKYGTSNITAIIPYLPSRQDKVFREGEISAVDMLFEMFNSVGINRIITIDPHFKRETGAYKTDTGIEYVVVSARNNLVTYANQNFELDDPLILSPDKGNKIVAESFGGVAMEKRRLGDYKVEFTEEKIPDVMGRDILLLDDMFSTCETAIAAIKNLKKHGARKIAAAATHGLFTNKSYNLLRTYSNDVVTTKTIPENPVARVDIDEILINGIRI